MDVTSLFKACVKTVRATNKTLGAKDQQPNILKMPPRDPNLEGTRDIIRQITKLRHFLFENRAAYLKINYALGKSVSEFDSQQIDAMAETVINKCNGSISDYKKKVKAVGKSKQQEEHYNCIVQSLERYLKEVSKMYTEAKAIRVKRVIETHKLSKLELSPPDTSTVAKPNGSPNLTTVPKAKTTTPLPPSPTVENHESELSAEELQMFQEENDLLYNELNSISDEVQQMESKVVHIAELQEMFTEKVLQQDKDIERIATTVVSSTENMKDANDQIRQAIQRNAGLRVWVLFFLLVMSFSLLFLDWYND